MARTVVTSTKLARDGAINDVAGVAIDQPNGMQVLFNKPHKTMILISNTSASTRVVTVRKSSNSHDNPLADFSSPAIPATTGLGVLGPFSGLYIQGDRIYLDFVAGHTGVVRAYELP